MNPFIDHKSISMRTIEGHTNPHNAVAQIQSDINNDKSNYNVDLLRQDLILINSSNDDLEKAWLVKAIIEKEYYKPHSVGELASHVGGAYGQ